MCLIYEVLACLLFVAHAYNLWVLLNPQILMDVKAVMLECFFYHTC